ncbi:integrin alpha [Nitrosococcus oceani]|uniref:integrin alpha n=1 Tax=Nitrosococcus oceani TaxID=1229 RepID=UPI0004E90888|nr:integrin alpha [Nitrosococcus oceani]KFI22264.1 integrin [Nitrosococcus oceani]
MNNKHNPTSFSISCRLASAAEFSAAVPRTFALRPLAVALRRVLGGGLLAAGLMGPALGQSPGTVLSPAPVTNQSKSLDLSTLNGANGFTFDGWGGSVNRAGDVNGDGFDDLVISGCCVVFGTSGGFPAALDPSTLDGSNGFVFNSRTISVSGAGDVNGDGFNDLVIGASRASPNGLYSGQSYVVFGTNTGFPAALELSTLDGSNGFALNGIAAFDDSGRSVSGAGDVNGDGFDDLVIGAPGIGINALSRAGQSYVVFGAGGGFPAVLELSTLDGSNGFALNGIAASNGTGRSVSGAGDVNGDGFDDLVIGAPGVSLNDVSGVGQSYVVFGTGGGFPAVLELSTLDGSNGFTLNGIVFTLNGLGLYSSEVGGRSGFSVSGAGDVNGDGFDDLVIGAPDAGPNGVSGAGQSYVVFGRSGGFPPVLDLSALDGSNGFVLNNAVLAFSLYSFEVGGHSGYSVSGAGDVNRDGFDDLVIGAPFTGFGGNYSGRSYVVFGTNTGFPAALELSALDGSKGFALNGSAADDSSGRSVSGAGDVNGDGFDDIVVGGEHQSYVVFGRSSASGPATLFNGLLTDVGTLSLPAGLERWLARRCGDVFNRSGLCSGSRSFQRSKPPPPPGGF